MNRVDIVLAALEWVGTPYHNQSRIKQVGVDCAQLVAGVAHQCGLITEADLGKIPTDYNPQHHIHSSQEKLLALLGDFGCVEVPKEDVRAGDIVTFQYGRATSHLGIVVSENTFVHAEGRISGKVVETYWNDEFLRRWTHVFQFPGVSE